MNARALRPALGAMAMLAALTLPATRVHANVPAAEPPQLASRFALPVGDPGLPGGPLLAQRTIVREWGPSEDSTYRVIEVPGWKSEGLALGMSAALPGTGQLYAGEASGWLYLIAESAGWMGRWLERRTASRRYDDLARFVGDPSDSTSGFSFVRYSRQTGTTADDLVTLWNGDRNAFYRALAGDPRFTPGFAGADPATGYAHFSGLLSDHDDALHKASLLEGILLVHHLVAAVDAIRAARNHNFPLREQYQLQLDENWSHGRPELRAAVVRRF